MEIRRIDDSDAGISVSFYVVLTWSCATPPAGGTALHIRPGVDHASTIVLAPIKPDPEAPTGDSQ